jgi:glycosyltransferase involved in cell wall biosynthesis
MKICLITAFPPSRGGLSEYGFHIARELRRNRFLNLTVLADTLPTSEDESADFPVRRCWSFDDYRSPRNILKIVRELDPDVVWFNLLFTTFGHNPLIAFGGLATPLLTRLSGYYTHVTLHHLMEAVDLEDAGVRFPRFYRMAGAVATRMLLLSNSVSVLMPAYRNILQERYGGDNVHFRMHGIFQQKPEFPDFSRRGNPLRILAFGKWGTYKRLEPMIEAFDRVIAALPGVKLVIAGGDHPRTPGYTAGVAQQCAGRNDIQFTGYVPEEQIPELFQSATVVVLPYSSATGASGVAHLACAYGVPMVSSDLPDFRHMATEEGMAISFYTPGETNELAERLLEVLASPERQMTMAQENFSAALRMTMPQIMQQYVRHFDVAQRTKTLRSLNRLRQMPRWVPSKAIVARAIANGWKPWGYRPPQPYLVARATFKSASVDGDNRSSGAASGSRIGVDGDGVGAVGGIGSDLRIVSRGGEAPAGGKNSDQGKQEESLQPAKNPTLPAGDGGKREHHSEDGNDGGVKDSGIPIFSPVTGNRVAGGTNGKHRTATGGSNGNGSGSKGTAKAGRQVAAGKLNRSIESAGLWADTDLDLPGGSTPES